MVRALLAGTKTQTRRIVKYAEDLVDADGWPLCDLSECGAGEVRAACPYGLPGDRLWVREAFMHEPADYCWEASVSIPCRPAVTVYRADHDAGESRGAGWKPSIHMPRALSRITLEITGVRVERLHDISEKDARAEGSPCVDEVSGREVLFPDASKCGTFKLGYRCVWGQINGPGSWDANPWVWVVEFKRVP